MTQRKRRLLIAVIIIAILGMVGIHYYREMKNMKAQWGHMPPAAVTTMTVKLQNWQTKVPATGSMNAQQGTLLKSEVAGRVTKIYFRSGQQINTNASLIDIDPGIAQANTNAAIAEANLTSGDYKRAIALYRRGALSKQDLDTALANKNTDAAKLDAAKAQLAQNSIHAPYSGQLGLCLVNVGDYVTEGQSLVNLQSLDPLRVDFTVPEKYTDQVHIGDKVKLTSDVAPNKLFTGQVNAVDSAIDPDTRTLAVRALIANPQHLLLPGNFVQVTLFMNNAQRPTIPQTALMYEADENYVYKIVKGHAVKVAVTIGQQNDHQAEITSGLKAGDVVVTAGQLKIHDGAPVRVE